MRWKRNDKTVDLPLSLRGALATKQSRLSEIRNPRLLRCTRNDRWYAKRRGSDSAPFYLLELTIPLSGSQCRLQIGIGRGDLPDIEVLHQEVEDVGGEVGRQRRAELDVLDTQVQQRQEDDVGLLLVPGEDK